MILHANSAMAGDDRSPVEVLWEAHCCLIVITTGLFIKISLLLRDKEKAVSNFFLFSIRPPPLWKPE